MDKNFIGKNIQQQRFNKGMSIRQMASVLSITPAKLNDIELGNSLPDIELLQLMETKVGLECSACVEFLLYYAKKNFVKSQNKEVPKVQVCYDRNNPKQDIYDVASNYVK